MGRPGVGPGWHDPADAEASLYGSQHVHFVYNPGLWDFDYAFQEQDLADIPLGNDLHFHDGFGFLPGPCVSLRVGLTPHHSPPPFLAPHMDPQILGNLRKGREKVLSRYALKVL